MLGRSLLKIAAFEAFGAVFVDFAGVLAFVAAKEFIGEPTTATKETAATIANRCLEVKRRRRSPSGFGIMTFPFHGRCGIAVHHKILYEFGNCNQFLFLPNYFSNTGFGSL